MLHETHYANLITFYRWIAGKLAEILGTEDDVVTELCFNLIEGSRYVCYTYSELDTLTKANDACYSPISSPCRSS